MILKQPEFRTKLERINRTYFSNPERWISVEKGKSIVRQGEPSRRLYLIRSGHVTAYRHFVSENSESASASHRIYEVFRAGPGAYVGVQSYFSKWYRSSSDIVAKTDVELAYIDDTVQAVDEEHHGTLLEQFVPTIIHELALRNLRVFATSVEKTEALRALHRSELSATLGELSAGLAHELNNSVGVLTRKTDFVAAFIDGFLEQYNGAGAELFRLGRDHNQVVSSETLRTVARDYEDRYGLSQPAAKVLARIAPTVEQAQQLDGRLIKNLRDLSSYWELGNDIRDMKLAAKHASGIVKSVKLLGNTNRRREKGVNIIDSISEAISLLKSDIRNIRFDAELPPREAVPLITADVTEFVQIWINIIKNACEAMKNASTPDPSILLICRYVEGKPDITGEKISPGHIEVEIVDNGPGVPDIIREKIFSPNFTTKKKGLSFGLGLGLAIVQRILDSYNGSISYESRPGRTTFTVSIPTSETYGKN